MTAEMAARLKFEFRRNSPTCSRLQSCCRWFSTFVQGEGPLAGGGRMPALQV